MSTYYKYNFVSPEPIYSIVKEELKSYFDTGAVDDLLFPTYVDKVLKKLGRTSYKIVTETLFIEDFQSRLPDNFHAVKEAWMCTEIGLRPYQDANSFYSQSETNIVQVSPITTNCVSPTCTIPNCCGDLCSIHVDQIVYKTNNTTPRSFRKEYLLKPGNISAKSNCDVTYKEGWELNRQIETPGASSYDSFDIRDNKFVTNFRKGIVHLVMYVLDYDEIGNELIPDNYRIKEYIEAFIKYKVFEMLTNQTNDETFNQLQQKLIYYKQLSDEAYILANIEIKQQDSWTKQRRIKTGLNRFNMYELPRSNNNYRRRNN